MRVSTSPRVTENSSRHVSSREMPAAVRELVGQGFAGGPAAVAAVEVGGSSVQSVVVDGDGLEIFEGVDVSRLPATWGLAAPGLVTNGRVQGAHHLGWMDVDAPHELGIGTRPAVSLNDAEAAALGEWFLSGTKSKSLLYVGIGTGVASALVVGGEVENVEFSHLTSFSDRVCEGCGRQGCLDATVGGASLPTPLRPENINRVVESLSRAVEMTNLPGDTIVVVSGGLVSGYPEIVQRLDSAVSRHRVVPTFDTMGLKSAAYAGLLLTMSRPQRQQRQQRQ